MTTFEKHGELSNVGLYATVTAYKDGHLTEVGLYATTTAYWKYGGYFSRLI